MRTMLLRSGSALLATHDSMGSPRALLAVLRARLAQLHGTRAVGTLTLTPSPREGAAAATLRDDVAGLVPLVTQRSDGYELVHALDLPSAAVALVARRETGIPVVVRDQPAARETSGRGRGNHATWSAVLRAADGVVVPTLADAQAARRAGVPAERVTVCADGALVARAQCAEPVASPAETAEHPFLLGLSGVPDLPAVREGLVAALDADHSLRVVLAGCERADDDRTALLDLARGRGAADRLELHETLPPEQMLNLVDASAAVVMTRSDPSCALSALVAMLRARPVVGVRTVCADDVLVDGVTGRLVDPGEPGLLAEALVRTASDPFRRLSWGLAGLDRVSARYDREVVMASMLGAYERAA